MAARDDYTIEKGTVILYIFTILNMHFSSKYELKWPQKGCFSPHVLHILLMHLRGVHGAVQFVNMHALLETNTRTGAERDGTDRVCGRAFFDHGMIARHDDKRKQR